MRLIDADALMAELREGFTEKEDDNKWLADEWWWAATVRREINEAPTVGAVPVKHGHWKEVDDGWDGVYYECSECGMSWTLNDGTPEENEMYYCPKCGARMDGERQEDDDDSEV